jgi:uncharacterized membrane protein
LIIASLILGAVLVNAMDRYRIGWHAASHTSITLITRADILPGRALAQTGAVTPENNLITEQRTALA